MYIVGEYIFSFSKRFRWTYILQGYDSEISFKDILGEYPY